MALWLMRSSKHFDVIHVHMAWSFTAMIGLVAARLRGAIAVLTPHETLTDYDREKSGPVKTFVKWSLRAAYVRLFDLVVVASPLERESIGRAGHRRSVVIAHAVQPGGSPAPRAQGDGCRVGFLARLDPKKNLEVLIQALALLPDSVSLRVAGAGPPEYERSLRALAAEHHVEGRVTWLGFVEPAQKDDFLASIDVLAMPSAFECFGVSAAEAMWAGIPVVVSTGVGIAHVVSQHSCGRVVAPTAVDVARGIRELAEPEARKQASESARPAAEAEFSRAAHGERLMEAYEVALRTRSERRGRRGRSANR
jgi:glycosyltransferase involved in cell wall biosynthesis